MGEPRRAALEGAGIEQGRDRRMTELGEDPLLVTDVQLVATGGFRSPGDVEDQWQVDRLGHGLG